MPRRVTQDVKDFVEDILESLPNPKVEDVTDQVFLAIEQDADLCAKYLGLCRKHGRGVVNRQGPKWIWKALGKPHNLGKGAAKSRLIPSGQYSRFAVSTMTWR